MDDAAFALAHDGMNHPASYPTIVTDPDHATDNHFDLRHRTQVEADACRVCNGTQTTAEAARDLGRHGFDLHPARQENPAGPLDEVA